MKSEIEFLEMELRWVRQVRATRNSEILHLVEPAVLREREILARLNVLRSPLAAAAEASVEQLEQ